MLFRSTVRPTRIQHRSSPQSSSASSSRASRSRSASRASRTSTTARAGGCGRGAHRRGAGAETALRGHVRDDVRVCPSSSFFSISRTLTLAPPSTRPLPRTLYPVPLQGMMAAVSGGCSPVRRAWRCSRATSSWTRACGRARRSLPARRGAHSASSEGTTYIGP